MLHDLGARILPGPSAHDPLAASVGALLAGLWGVPWLVVEAIAGRGEGAEAREVAGIVRDACARARLEAPGVAA